MTEAQVGGKRAADGGAEAARATNNTNNAKRNGSPGPSASGNRGEPLFPIDSKYSGSADFPASFFERGVQRIKN